MFDFRTISCFEDIQRVLITEVIINDNILYLDRSEVVRGVFNRSPRS